VNRPEEEPQLLLEEEVETPAALKLRLAKIEIRLLVSGLWQTGQAGMLFASEKRTIFSNS
jgi:hypothetical protein